MSRGPVTVICRDEDSTRLAGRDLVPDLAAGDLVSLEGPLGAGKTVFIKGLAEGLGIDPEAVTSPSFVLAVEHRARERSLLHCDLYRLPEGAGLDDLGIEEALGRGWIVAVEWGERLPGFLRRAAWRVVVSEAPIHGPGARALTVLPPEDPV